MGAKIGCGVVVLFVAFLALVIASSLPEGLYRGHAESIIEQVDSQFLRNALRYDLHPVTPAWLQVIGLVVCGAFVVGALLIVFVVGLHDRNGLAIVSMPLLGIAFIVSLVATALPGVRKEASLAGQLHALATTAPQAEKALSAAFAALEHGPPVAAVEGPQLPGRVMILTVYVGRQTSSVEPHAQVPREWIKPEEICIPCSENLALDDDRRPTPQGQIAGLAIAFVGDTVEATYTQRGMGIMPGPGIGPRVYRVFAAVYLFEIKDNRFIWSTRITGLPADAPQMVELTQSEALLKEFHGSWPEIAGYLNSLPLRPG